MWQEKWNKFGILLGFAFLGFLVYYFSEIVTYILIAWILSMLGRPVMYFFITKFKFGKIGIGSGGAAILTIFSFLTLITVIGWVFIPSIAEQAGNLASVDYNAVIKSLDTPLGKLSAQLQNWDLIPKNQSVVELALNDIKHRVDPTRVSTMVQSILGAAGKVIFAFFSILFITFFFLKEQRLFLNFLMKAVSNKYREHVIDTVNMIRNLLSRYFTGVILQITIITIFVSSFLALLGIKNALLIGFFAGVVNVIPYVGIVLAVAFGMFITISSNLDLNFYSEIIPKLLRVGFVFLCMQMFDNFVVQPNIFAKSVKAHPLEIFVVILIAAKIGGIPAMVVAIPVYTIIRVVANVFLKEFEVIQKITSKVENP
jgi:predicted PurR-regulated permease PerM